MKTRLLSLLLIVLCLLSPGIATAVSPTTGEKSRSRQWAAARFEVDQESKTIVPFFSFQYGGKSSTELLPTWERKQSSQKLDDHRTEYTLTWTDAKTGLVMRCVGVEYGDFPAVEWTLYFKNTSDKDTPVLADIQALDLTVARETDAEFTLHSIVGDTCTATALSTVR